MQRAYVLRVRPFKDHQHLVHLLTEYDGCFTAIARISQGKRKHNSQAALRLFQPLFIEWKGQSELKRLSHFETCAREIPLNPEATLMAYYVNELCLRLLHKPEPFPELLNTYHDTLMQLAKTEASHQALRYFELCLLQHLGSLPSLEYDSEYQAIQAEQSYLFRPMTGFMLNELQASHGYSGSLLIALANKDLSPHLLPPAKRLLQQMMQPLLGTQPLASRALYQQYKRNQS